MLSPLARGDDRLNGSGMPLRRLHPGDSPVLVAAEQLARTTTRFTAFPRELRLLYALSDPGFL
jgi:hypothetical protein